MQFTVVPQSTPELRLFAAFLGDLADLRELVSNPPAKVSRKKPAAVVEEAVIEPVAVESAPAPEENAPAPVENTPPESVITHDTLRIRFGELSQAGKRPEAVAIFKQFGFTGISTIGQDKLLEVYEALATL